jgi:hypothetical protein
MKATSDPRLVTPSDRPQSFPFRSTDVCAPEVSWNRSGSLPTGVVVGTDHLAADYQSARYGAHIGRGVWNKPPLALSGWRQIAINSWFVMVASVLQRLGEIGTLVMMRLMAFILLCVGIQIIWNGWADRLPAQSVSAPPLQEWTFRFDYSISSNIEASSSLSP